MWAPCPLQLMLRVRNTFSRAPVKPRLPEPSPSLLHSSARSVFVARINLRACAGSFEGRQSKRMSWKPGWPAGRDLPAAWRGRALTVPARNTGGREHRRA